MTALRSMHGFFMVLSCGSEIRPAAVFRTVEQEHIIMATVTAFAVKLLRYDGHQWIMSWQLAAVAAPCSVARARLALLATFVKFSVIN